MVEYALLVGVLGIGTVSGFTFLKDALTDTYEDTAVRASTRAPGIDGFASVQDFEIVNGPGVEGQADAGDRVIARFNGPLKVRILCDGWTGDDTDQPYGYPIPPGRTGMNVVIVNDAAADIYGDPVEGPHNDRLRIGSPGNHGGTGCGGVFNYGEVDLGSPDFVSADVTIEHSAASWGGGGSYELIVTLGPVSGVDEVGSTTATYYPSRLFEEPRGSLIHAPPVSSTGTHF